MSSKTPRRGKIFLSGTLQGLLVRRMAAYWALYHVVLWHGMFFLSYLEYRATLVSGEAEIPFIDLYGTFAWQYRSLALCAVAAGPIILWDVVRMTHRVVGPLVRLENTLRRMTHGEKVQQLKFRKGDYVVGLENAFNLYLASLNRSQVAVQPAATNEPPASAAAAPCPPSADEEALGTQTVEEYAPLLRHLQDINDVLAPIHVGEGKSSAGE